MKKVIFAIVTVFFLIQLSACLKPTEVPPLRLHVVANSNSPEDQAVKLKVRDDLLAFSGESMANAKSGGEAEDYILSHIGEITQNANNVLNGGGFDYTAAASVGEFYFPEKKYGDTVYPAGKYRALKIVLGDGKGDNWWCVIFPPLCIVADGKGEGASDGKKGAAKGEITYKSIFSELFNKS